MSLITKQVKTPLFTSRARQVALMLSLLVAPFAVAGEADIFLETQQHAQAGLADDAQQNHRVNINTANAEVLANKLKGIGLVKAEAIVGYRAEFGAFSAPSDLAKVKGIGAKTVALFEDQLVF